MNKSNLSDVGLTNADVRKIVDRTLDDDIDGRELKILNSSVQPYSRDRRIGILARHSVLEVSIEDQHQHQQLRYFVKSANPSDHPLSSSLEDCYFPEEVHFYDRVSPILFRQNQPSFAPKCYLAKKNVLVLEDLRLAGYANARLTGDFFDLEHLRLGLEALASFHGSSLLAEREAGERLDRLFPGAFAEKQFFAPEVAPERAFNRQVLVTLATLSRLTDYFGLRSVDSKDAQIRLRDAVNSDRESLRVLCHGDVYKNNFMFRYESGDSKCALVDFQFLRYGSPCLDVAMFMYANAGSRAVRESLEREMLGVYWKRLREIAGVEVGPSFEEVKEAYESKRLVGSFYALMSLPSLLLPVEVAEELVNNDARMKTYFLDDRVDVIVPVLDRNEDYRGKIREVVEEFVEVFYGGV